jgi:hypothetical protein
MEGVKMWLSSQAADFFDTGKQKRIPQYDKCLNSGGDLSMYVFFVYNNISHCLFFNRSPEVIF